MIPYDKKLKNHAQYLRANLTVAEKKLWSRLRGKQILNIQFYRQKTIGRYIVDFYAAQARLVIELDGSQHQETAHKRRDCLRDRFLKNNGLNVLRFHNREVLHHLDGVLAQIFAELVKVTK